MNDVKKPGSKFVDEWKTEPVNRKFRITFAIVVIITAVIIFAFTQFLAFNETRTGFVFTDPVLKHFTALDLSLPIFIVIYLALISALKHLAPHPRGLLTGVLAYALLLVFRMAAMYSLPLAAPEGAIPLVDPFVQFFSTGTVLEKDLFFSGHTATLFLFFLAAVDKKFKAVFLISAILVAAGVLLQQVHYTVDVIAAPFFSFGSYKLSDKIIRAFTESGG